MRKALVLLLCALAVFAIVSCKQDPPAPEKCTVTFNSEGGTEIAPVSLEKGAKVAKPADPVKVGSYFCGWFKDSKYENAYDFSAAVTESFTLYAKFEEGTIYRVTSLSTTSADGNRYDKFIVSFPDAKVGPGDVVSITFRTTEPFTQYSIRRYGDNKKFFHEKSKGDYPLFFTAKEDGEDGWTTITYVFPEEGAATQDADASKYPEGGIGFNVYFRNQKMVPGAYMELKAVAINDKEYTLTEASVNPTGDLGNVVSDFEVISWIPRKVTFDTDDGTEIPAVTVPYGQRVAKPEDPEKEGVLFYGWYEDEELEEEFDFDTLIFKDTTIYAKYAPPVTVTFNTGEGGPVIEPVTIPKGYSVDEPAEPKKEGYLFGGWFTDAECTKEYDFDDEVEANLTLYAKWLYVYVVTLNVNDGTGATKIVYAPKETGELPVADMRIGRPGYFLDGWYTQATGGDKINIAEYTVTADMEIYAHWTAPTSTYKFTVTSLKVDDVEYECDRIGLRWKYDNSTVVAAGLQLYDFKKGDVVTFRVKSTPDKGNLLSTIRLRTVNGSTDFFKYYTIADAEAGKWVDVTLVLEKDAAGTSKNGLILAFYDENQKGTVKEGDVLEIMGVALNGAELPITTDSSSCGFYPNWSSSDKYWYGAPGTIKVDPIVQ